MTDKKIKLNAIDRARKMEQENYRLKAENEDLRTIIAEQADALVELAEIITEEV